MSTADLIDDIRTAAMAGDFDGAYEALTDLRRDMKAWGAVRSARAEEFWGSARAGALQGAYFGDPAGRRARIVGAELAIVARLLREYGITD
jgi:hypothetical protein